MVVNVITTTLLGFFIFVISTRKHDLKAEITKPDDINFVLPPMTYHLLNAFSISFERTAVDNSFPFPSRFAPEERERGTVCNAKSGQFVAID